MNAILTSPPAPGARPTWAQHWANVTHEWDLAARHIFELDGDTKRVVTTYLRWAAGAAGRNQPPWWHSEIDWAALMNDVTQGFVPLSGSKKSLIKIAHGIVSGSGTFDYHAMHAAGFLEPIRGILTTAAN